MARSYKKLINTGIIWTVKDTAGNDASGIASISSKGVLSVKIVPSVSGQRATGTELGTDPTVEWSVEDRYSGYLSVDTEGNVTGKNTGKNIPTDSRADGIAKAERSARFTVYALVTKIQATRRSLSSEQNMDRNTER